MLLLKKCTVLSGLKEDKWTEDHRREILLFLQDPTIPMLLLYVDQTTDELCIVNGVPPIQTVQASYFVRVKEVAVTASNFHSALQMGTVQGSHVGTLLRVMNGLYAPNFFENKTWPDSIHISRSHSLNLLVDPLVMLC